MAFDLELNDKMSVDDYKNVYRYIEEYGLDELAELYNELGGKKSAERAIRRKLMHGDIDIDLDLQVLYQLSWYLNYFLAKTKQENPNGIIDAQPYLLNLEKLNELGVTSIRLMHGNELGFRNRNFFLLEDERTCKLYSDAPITYISTDDPHKKPFRSDIVIPATAKWKLEAHIQNGQKPWLQLTTKSILNPVGNVTELYSLDPPRSFLHARTSGGIVQKKALGSYINI